MERAGFREEVSGDTRDALPGYPVGLAAPPERTSPEVEDVVAEGRDGLTIGRDGVVCEEALDNLPQPSSLVGDGLVHSPPQLLLDLLELRPRAVGTALPLEEEAAFVRSAADMREAEEVEGLRFSEPAPLALRRRVAAELDQAGLLRM